MLLSVEDINIISDIVRKAERMIELRTGHNVGLYVKDDPKRNLSYMDVIALVSKTLELKASKIVSAHRFDDYIQARYICYLVLAKEFPALTREKMGVLFNKDASSITNGIKAASNMVATKHEPFCMKYKRVLKELEEWQLS